MIAMPKSLTIEQCEALIEKLGEFPDESLELPVETAKFAFAGMAAAVQAAITWGRNNKKRELILKKSIKSIDDQTDEIIRRPHKFTAAMFSQTILRGDDNSDIRRIVNGKAKDAVLIQFEQQYGQQLGGFCWNIFVDHSSLAFDPKFYLAGGDVKPQPRGMEQIGTVIRAMLAKSVDAPGGGRLPANEDLRHLEKVFYELFLNTHEHGRFGTDRASILRPSVRLIYSNGINLDFHGVSEMFKREPVLKQFIDKSTKVTRFLELSVVDSGVGYAERWRMDHPSSHAVELDVTEEYRLFKKCFSFRQSSTGADHKGNGLPVVMARITKLKGFMRVRSGHLSLYRDFVARPYQDDQDTCEFYDWSTQNVASEHLTKQMPVAGVAITLLIPLEEKA